MSFLIVTAEYIGLIGPRKYMFHHHGAWTKFLLTVCAKVWYDSNIAAGVDIFGYRVSFLEKNKRMFTYIQKMLILVISLIMILFPA